ncbi:MAG: M48 family metalloprotease [Ahrensia sp.]|nr:M48 family metalloprotease [Ahrensia sp.]
MSMVPTRNNWLYLIAVCLLASGMLVHAIGSAYAQRPRLALIRDAEIEALVADYAAPLMRAANLRRGSVDFYIVNDRTFNAFVSGRGMFLHTGLLLTAETPEEVIGVIAHELGHIVGAHQIRLRQRLETASRLATITSLLGLGLGAAASAAGVRSGASAGFGVAAGAQGFALRDVLRYQRGEETAADRTAAELLHKTKQSGRGMLKTLQRLASSLSIISGRVDPYTISHPLPNARIAALEDVLRRSPYFDSKSSAALRLRHDMVRAKIAAYVGGNDYARSLLSSNELAPPARAYGRAITTFLYGSPKRALPMIDDLIRSQAKNAYVHEMKGEILLRSGKPAEAAKSFRRAIALDRTKAGFIRVQLGHALVQTGRKGDLDEAIVELNKGLASDPSAVAGYQYLAMAHGQKGNQGLALLASAELAVRTGRKKEARQYARRAQQSFKRGSPSWLRAEDIVIAR